MSVFIIPIMRLRHFPKTIYSMKYIFSQSIESAASRFSQEPITTTHLFPFCICASLRHCLATDFLILFSCLQVNKSFSSCIRCSVCLVGRAQQREMITKYIFQKMLFNEINFANWVGTFPRDMAWLLFLMF